MMVASAARVVRVPRLEEQARWSPPAPVHLPAKVTHEAPEPLVFELEGFDEADEAEDVLEAVTVSALHQHATIARLLAPAVDGAPIRSAAQQAVQASGGDLQGTAAVLERLGWTVKVCSSRGGSLSQLRHTYLIATRHTHLQGEPAEWVIDPSFADAFAVTHPTPRLRHILSAVPPLVVAPLGRLLRALLMLGAELERCFTAQQVPLPPWRSADALASRYERTAAPAAAVSSAAAIGSSSGAAAAAARKQARTVQQLERVQLKLLKMGLEPVAAPASTLAAAHFPASSSSSSSGADSPTSVIQADPAGSTLAHAFHNATKAPEWVCCGWAEPEPGRRQGSRFRGGCPGGSSSSRRGQGRLAASAA